MPEHQWQPLRRREDCGCDAEPFIEGSPGLLEALIKMDAGAGLITASSLVLLAAALAWHGRRSRCRSLRCATPVPGR